MNLPQMKIQNLNIEPSKRILVTSDIHGHLSHLKNVLEKAKFCDTDILFIVGDIVEKGPKSLKTLRYIMELYEKGNVFPLIGNVDACRLYMINDIWEDSIQGFYDYICQCRKWCGSSFYEELTDEIGIMIENPSDILNAKDKVIAHFAKELDFLAGLPTAIETQKYIFVHGGLIDKNISDNQNRNAFDLLKYDNFYDTDMSFEKYVVCGHTPVTLYSEIIQQCNPIIDKKKKIISIDGGMGIKSFGQLNLLIIPDINCNIDDVNYISYDEMPVFKAKASQKESEHPVNIRWTDNKINIIEKGDDFSFIEHISTEKTLWIPNSYLRNDTSCYDITDYVLPVEVGDSLSFEKETSRGYIMKKDGVIGWYYGKIEKVGNI